MSRSDRVIKTTIIYFIGNFASRLLSFILLPLYTAYLTSEDYGTVDILMSTFSLIAPIFTMQVTESVFRFLITDSTNEDRKITITNAFTIFVSGFLFFTILYIPFLIKFDFSYGFLFIVYFFITYIGIFLQQILRGLQRTIEYAITGVISTIVHATLNIILIVKVGLGGEALLISSIAGSFVIVLLISTRIKLIKYLDIKKISKKEIRKQLAFGVPLVPNQIAWWVIGLLGKYILLYFHSAADNGILAVANKFPSILTIVNTIFLQAWTENVIKEYDTKDGADFFNAGHTSFAIFTISFVSCLLPVIKVYNILTISGEFKNAWVYIPILIIGSSFNSLAAFLGTIYTASMKTKQAFNTTIISAISNLLLSLVLIPKLSIWGVIIANAISFLVLYLVRVKSIKGLINLKMDFMKLIPSLMVLMVSIFSYYALGIYYQILAVFIFGVVFLYLNRKLLIRLFDFVIKIKNIKHIKHS